MIVDTSAVFAILAGEGDARRYADALAAGASVMSAGTYLECGIVVDRKGLPQVGRAFDSWLRTAEIEVVPVSVEQARIARRAYADFGKGGGHRAQLNFGDCFAYALAVERDEPLLFKGDDFIHTGIRSALR
ncbi:MAG TPA: type II toxin-antitoxin system VapC family toxin [Gordonia sp. (in: high G+C Gram-positive bacteria)]|uniref:type II toxin-antitoxin system VapC family toxin n=1 Tax=unclassified Gordonia (in: high G+C Gram-positive bacteria) TaxID=2657482 RepID=UPI000FB04628|nr:MULTISPECIES: type II toxin-antitoxin system VapC family toxin [unclassified Gordonia (in: high G+C Gram-positive bacteria)]RUP37746.1 MAG: type II toxin-antitoxin system VapC family toxin [Gordonia sp. (in: high G+C Gram-positive bacteria)]HNP55410.1 type II toxin-antitoxin system VapC family toxin [Gordonia sp. (in: high G+C Gram-positive bacteria)]HRC51636.1 type II toxin-antitoxin system VapC family toxin [Gordonia sp. (in: high G+C Gram-positive bacteria)]